MIFGVLIVASQAFAGPPRVALVLDRQTQKPVWRETAMGAQLAVEEIRASKREIELIEIDSGTSVHGTQKAVSDAVARRVDILVAEIDSSKAMVAAEVAEANTLVMITPFATSPRIVEGRQYVFRACSSDIAIGEQIARFAAAEGKRAAIVYDSGQLYSVTLRDAIKKAYTAAGGTITFEGSLLSTMNSYTELVDGIVSSKPDLVFLPFYEETVGRFLVDAAKNRKFQVLPLVGGDGWASGAFFESHNSAITEMTGTWVTHHDPEHRSKITKDFVEKYKRRFGTIPETSAAFLSYDSMQIAFAAVEAAGNDRRPESILRALRALRDHPGVTGAISFGSSNEPNKPLFKVRYEKGKIRSLGELRP